MNDQNGGPNRDAPPPADGAGGKPGGRAGERGRPTAILESAVAELFRRGIEAGIDRVSRGEGKAAIRAVIGDLRIPKEVTGYVASQFDDTKAAILKVVAREVREFLETSHFGDELARILTTLSFEIRTEVRFVPNEKGEKLRPKVTSRARIKRRRPGDA